MCLYRNAMNIFSFASRLCMKPLHNGLLSPSWGLNSCLIIPCRTPFLFSFTIPVPLHHCCSRTPFPFPYTIPVPLHHSSSLTPFPFPFTIPFPLHRFLPYFSSLTMILPNQHSYTKSTLKSLSAAKTSKLSLLVKHHILAIDEAS